MDTEQKAKAYDEALERAKEQLETAKVFDYKEGQIAHDIRETVYAIFPLLKESEDERIRKRIILCLEECVHNDIIRDYEKEKCLAWLEKQGWHTDKIVERAKTEKQRVLITESDGEANIDWDTRGLQDVKLLLEYGLDYVNKLEKQGGKKPADKVEPKFKAGDWYIDNEDGTIFQIVKVLDNTYTYKTSEGKEYSCSHYSLENDAHLWTIQDAKDGDVLYHKAENGIEYIVMNKGLNEHNNIDSYFRYNSVNGFGTDIPSVLSAKCDSITPATKEQRDLLFQKMHEAGYEWDAEKKKLKKIEQKPAWSEEDEIRRNSAIEHLEESILNTPSPLRPYVREDIKWLRTLKERVQLQPKQEWSEEDEKRVNSILRFITIDEKKTIAAFGYNTFEELRNDISWLKSIKYRVVLQPKEWDEDDDAFLKDILCKVKSDLILNKNEKDWLKSLESRFKQRYWTEEEIEPIISDYLRGAEHYGGMIGRLRCLKPKSYWKPTDEQMAALANALSLAKNCGDESSFDLRTLYDDLKIL